MTPATSIVVDDGVDDPVAANLTEAAGSLGKERFPGDLVRRRRGRGRGSVADCTNESKVAEPLIFS